MVGMAGFELATPCTPCKCATRLRYIPCRWMNYREEKQSPLGKRALFSKKSQIHVASCLPAPLVGKQAHAPARSGLRNECAPRCQACIRLCCGPAACDETASAQASMRPGLPGMTVIPETPIHQHSLTGNCRALVAPHGNIDSTKAVHTSGFPGSLR